MNTIALALVLALLAAVTIGGTIRSILRDGRGMTPPPASHRVDSDSVPPALRLG